VCRATIFFPVLFSLINFFFLQDTVLFGTGFSSGGEKRKEKRKREEKTQEETCTTKL